MRFHKPSILIAALAPTLLGPIAWCKPPETRSELVREVHVDLKGLDLQNTADAHTLLERLRSAAYHACGGDPRLHYSYRTQAKQTVRVYEECRVNAVKRAIDQIGAPTLTQIYAEEEPRQSAAAACVGREHRAEPLLRTQ